jgi:hypothetical protein
MYGHNLDKSYRFFPNLEPALITMFERGGPGDGGPHPTHPVGPSRGSARPSLSSSTITYTQKKKTNRIPLRINLQKKRPSGNKRVFTDKMRDDIVNLLRATFEYSEYAAILEEMS